MFHVVSRSNPYRHAPCPLARRRIRAMCPRIWGFHGHPILFLAKSCKVRHYSNRELWSLFRGPSPRLLRLEVLVLIGDGGVVILHRALPNLEPHILVEPAL